MDRGGWFAIDHGVARSWTQLSNYAHTYGLKNTREKFFSISMQMKLQFQQGLLGTEGNNRRLYVEKSICKSGQDPAGEEECLTRY